MSLKLLHDNYNTFILKIRAFFLCLVLAIIFCFSQFTQSNAEPAVDPNAVFSVEVLAIVTSTGRFEFSVEIADDTNERSQGLMFREEMLPTHGMLFDFGETSPVAMWMKNTPLSLDMVFIKHDGIVARVANKTTPFSQAIISSGEPVSHVLELNAGMANQIGLKAGDRVIHTFFTK